MKTASHNATTRPWKSSRRRSFSLIEMVVAMGLLMILAGGAFCGFRLISDAQRRSMRKRKALHVVDNTIERLAVEHLLEDQIVQETLRDEFTRSDLTTEEDLLPECVSTGTGWWVIVRRRGGREIASAEVLQP